MDAHNEAAQLFDQLVAWRRDLHQHPELGLEETRTAGIVTEILRDLGYTVHEGIATTGVVGILENGDGPVLMSRVDMDALPIQETNDVPYASQTPGKMHACGHDAHVAIGLGVATVMAQHRDAWCGTLMLIFQPGEEGFNGAEIMLNEGLFDILRPDYVLAVHVWNVLPVGKIGAAVGPVMAAAEFWEIEITGKGGHAASPHETVDPIATGALMVNALQTIVSRNVAPMKTAVVTVGQLTSGDTFNVIPDTATLRGTSRTFDPAVNKLTLRRIKEISQGIAQTMGATAEFTLHPVAPAVVNDAAVTHVVQQAVTDLFGADALKADERTMGSEDAAFFLREVPGCYIFVGSGFTDRPAPPHHNPKFDIDEQAMVNGVAVVVESARKLMK